MVALRGESVIVRDHAVAIIIKQAAVKRYAGATLPLLVAQLKTPH